MYICTKHVYAYTICNNTSIPYWWRYHSMYHSVSNVCINVSLNVIMYEQFPDHPIPWPSQVLYMLLWNKTIGNHSLNVLSKCFRVPVPVVWKSFNVLAAASFSAMPRSWSAIGRRRVLPHHWYNMNIMIIKYTPMYVYIIISIHIDVTIISTIIIIIIIIIISSSSSGSSKWWWWWWWWWW